MIRPSVAPFKKQLKQPQFSTSYTPTGTDRIILTKAQIEPSQINNKSQPLPNLFHHFKSDRQKTDRDQQFYQNKNIQQKIKGIALLIVQPLLKQRNQQILSIKQQIQQLKNSIPNLIKKSKFQIGEDMRKIIINLIKNEKQQERKQFDQITNKVNNIEEQFLKLEKENISNIQKVYNQIKQITKAMSNLNTKMENMQKGFPQENNHVFESKMRMISEIKQIVGSSKVSKVSEPQSIMSGYENSLEQTFKSEIKQQIPSLIRNLSIEEGESQMIIVDDNGCATDIQGMPIIDKNGNVLLIKLSQMKHLLQHQLQVQ